MTAFVWFIPVIVKSKLFICIKIRFPISWSFSCLKI